MAKKATFKERSMLPKWVIGALFLIISLLYITNLTHDIYGGDVGDLVTAAVVAGVPHPPGYPLFTLGGWLFSHLPIDIPPVTKVALVSFFSSLGALFFYYKIAGLLVKDKLIPLLTTAILATTYHFMLYSLIPEVFMLNVFICLGILYFSLKFYADEQFGPLLFVFFFMGLGLTNHQTVIFIYPFVLGTLFIKRKKLFRFGRRLFLLPLVFAAGLAPYLYIPIAASFSPIINWENASSLEGFIDLVTRRAYGTFSAGLFPKPVVELRTLLLKDYASSILASISLPVFFIGLLGIVYGLKKYRLLALLLLLSIFMSGPLFILYAGFPPTNTFILSIVERFYILSEILFLLFIPLGLYGLRMFFLRIFSKKIYASVLIFGLFLIPLFLAIKNYDKTDLSSISIGTDFGKDQLKNLPKNAVYFIQGDTRAFNIWYVRFVLGERRDVEVIQFGGHALRNDYFTKFYKANENLSLNEQRAAFLDAIVKVSGERQVFATNALPLLDNNYAWIPRGLNFQLVRKNDMPNLEEYKKLVRFDFLGIDIPERERLTIAERNLTTSDIPTYYAEAISKIAEHYYNSYADFSSALTNYRYATVVDPTYSKGYAGSALVNMKQGNCSLAKNNIERAILLNPVEKTYYQIMYLNYVECLKDVEKAELTVDAYNATFHSDMKKDLNMDKKQ